MITNFKMFEKLGVDDITIRIVDKIWTEFLKYYDKSKAFTDQIDEFNVDISEFKLKDTNEIDIKISYNEAKSQSGFCLKIGVISREAKRIKSLNTLKEDILHETKHLMYFLRRYGKMKGIKGFRKENDKKNFINPSGVSLLIAQDIIGSFKNTQGNVYNLRASIKNFLKYNQLSDSYKKLVVYLYFANEDELSARIQEFYNKAKTTNDFSEMLRKESKKQPLAGYKDMVNFKININDFSQQEKDKLFKYVFKPSDVKKVERYINQKGEQFVNKVHKLSYFNQEPNAELKST